MVRRQRLNDRISTMLERRIGVSRYFFRSLFAWKMKVRRKPEMAIVSLDV